MPKLNLDQFEDAPHVGDKVKVMGKVKSIDEDSGEVEVSYDDVSIVEKDKKTKKRKTDYFREQTPEEAAMEEQMNPNSQSLDQALSTAFPNTQ